MTDLDRSSDQNVYDLNAILHPGSVFDHPRDVLADTTLSWDPLESTCRHASLSIL